MKSITINLRDVVNGQYPNRKKSCGFELLNIKNDPSMWTSRVWKLHFLCWQQLGVSNEDVEFCSGYRMAGLRVVIAQLCPSDPPAG